nr:type II toxin-antitoxin system RelE/ParE family toxin [uncultured Holophaga sp.]
MEALKLRFAKRAERQVDEILGYIALDNPDAAWKVAERVMELAEKVTVFPEMGKQVFPDLPYREVLAYPCRIFYRRVGDTLWVVAVLRVEQLLRKELLTD